MTRVGPAQGSLLVHSLLLLASDRVGQLKGQPWCTQPVAVAERPVRAAQVACWYISLLL
jgi:hypothetical protein